MYNLSENLLGVDGCSVTPRTPEIVNSLMAMTNPLDYNFNVTKMSPYDSHSSSSGSPMDSPAGCNAPPSVQQTCSQLIKAGLKLSLQMKRKISSSESSGPESMKMAKLETPNTSDDEDDDDDLDSKSPRFGLTPEDEDRRRRRRERNKIAATKCRMKKRERTLNLVTESEVLETQNIDLKAQVRQLELERRKLTDMLHGHNATCLRPDGFQPPPPPTISVEKYIPDLGSDLSAYPSSGGAPESSRDPATPTAKNAHRPIPSVNTIKYGHTAKMAKTKRQQGNQQQRHQQLQPQHQLQQQHPQQMQQSPPLIDIGYCSSSGLTSTTDLLPSTYCKPSPNDYAMSPDSGFIKSPVDTSSTYPTSTSTPVSSSSTTVANNILFTSFNQNNHLNQQQPHQNTHNLLAIHVKNDHFDNIPNCTESTSISDHNHQLQHQQQHHHLDQLHQHLGLHVGQVPGDGSEFALKCETIDINSPYTTVNSADRFLFDGNDSHHYDSSNGLGICEDAICVDPVGRELRMGSNGEMHHSHNQLHLNNNNSHANSNNNNNNNNHHHNNNNSSSNCGSILEFNGQHVYDGLKADYLSNHSEFLVLTDGSDSQFTDMDSGITTYSQMVANSSNNGCMA